MHMHTERKFLNLFGSDIVQNIEMCLTMCDPFAAIWLVAIRDLLISQEE